MGLGGSDDGRCSPVVVYALPFSFAHLRNADGGTSRLRLSFRAPPFILSDYLIFFRLGALCFHIPRSSTPFSAWIAGFERRAKTSSLLVARERSRAPVSCFPVSSPANKPLTHPPPRILYKTQLPFILVFNKTDVEAADRAKEWMTDFEAFQEALASGSGKCCFDFDLWG